MRAARNKWKGICSKCKTKYIVYDGDVPEKKTCFCSGRIEWRPLHEPAMTGDAEPEVTS